MYKIPVSGKAMPEAVTGRGMPPYDGTSRPLTRKEDLNVVFKSKPAGKPKK